MALETKLQYLRRVFGDDRIVFDDNKGVAGLFQDGRDLERRETSSGFQLCNRTMKPSRPSIRPLRSIHMMHKSGTIKALFLVIRVSTMRPFWPMTGLSR